MAPVQIAFQDDEMWAICEDPVAAKLDDDLAAAIRRRLADLGAAETLADLEFLLDLSTMSADRVVLPLTSQRRLVARIDHSDVRRDVTGAIRWDRTNRIQIVAIENAKEPS